MSIAGLSRVTQNKTIINLLETVVGVLVFGTGGFIALSILNLDGAVLILSHMIQKFPGLGDAIQFTGDTYISFVLSSIVFFYGGWSFLKGLYDELKKRQPGMMTLIGIAITAAYVYSTLVVFGYLVLRGTVL